MSLISKENDYRIGLRDVVYGQEKAIIAKSKKIKIMP